MNDSCFVHVEEDAPFTLESQPCIILQRLAQIAVIEDKIYQKILLREIQVLCSER